jgi:hypothetical protein
LSGFATRWVVAREVAVTAVDLDADGLVTDAALERWIVGACDAYLERCTVLRAMREESDLTTSVRVGKQPGTERLHGAVGVLVSVRATEFFPDWFVVAVRVRGPDGVVDTTCEVRLEDAAGNAVPLTDDVRDELIALEHAAAHVN